MVRYLLSVTRRVATILSWPELVFIRRFLRYVLPRGFHRIRYYGFLANTLRTASLSKDRAGAAGL